MYIFIQCILIMDLASGVCHCCTMGLPPEETFLSIHSSWMPWLKPSVTDWGGGGDGGHRRSLLCLWSASLSFSSVRTNLWRNLTYGLRRMSGGGAPRLFSMYIITPYDISTYFIGLKRKQAYYQNETIHTFCFPDMIRATLRPFFFCVYFEATCPRASFQTSRQLSKGGVPVSACGHFLSHNF